MNDLERFQALYEDRISGLNNMISPSGAAEDHISQQAREAITLTTKCHERAILIWQKLQGSTPENLDAVVERAISFVKRCQAANYSNQTTEITRIPNEKAFNLMRELLSSHSIGGLPSPLEECIHSRFEGDSDINRRLILLAADAVRSAFNTRQKLLRENDTYAELLKVLVRLLHLVIMQGKGSELERNEQFEKAQCLAGEITTTIPVVGQIRELVGLMKALAELVNSFDRNRELDAVARARQVEKYLTEYPGALKAWLTAVDSIYESFSRTQANLSA